MASQKSNQSEKSIKSRSMFNDGFIERHDLEQFFWTEDTVHKLMKSLEHFQDCCCLTTPSLAHAWHLEGKEEALYDIDERFKYLPKYRYYDLRSPESVDEKFKIVIFDPPFFYLPMKTLFDAVSKIVNYDYSTKILIAFLKREEDELLKYFSRFNLKRTNFPLKYATVKENKWQNYCLYSNVDLPFIKRTKN